MKKVVVIGSNGLLGQSLTKRFTSTYNLSAVSRGNINLNDDNVAYRQLDIINRSEVYDFLNAEKPDIIINAAAYTDVDGSETEREICWNTNVRALENIIDSTESFKPILVQVSTDYVFDGQKGWYTEEDSANPRGNYARSKYAAENIVISSKLEYIIARTQVLYGTGNNVKLNFVTWVIRSLKNREKIRVVSDQVGNPTFVDDLSEGVNRLIEGEEYGLFHISGKEVINRYEFALKIAEVFSLDKSLIEKISTEDLNQIAPRPLNSSFVIDKLVNRTGWEPDDVLAGLERLKIMLNGENG